MGRVVTAQTCSRVFGLLWFDLSVGRLLGTMFVCGGSSACTWTPRLTDCGAFSWAAS